MRWNCLSKAFRFLQITAEHQDCPFFTFFLTVKTLSQNISITLLQISFKLHEHRGGYWRKKVPWTILEEHFPVPRNTAASKIGNSVISLLWQLLCHCNTDHSKFSSLSNTTVVAIFFVWIDVFLKVALEITKRAQHCVLPWFMFFKIAQVYLRQQRLLECSRVICKTNEWENLCGNIQKVANLSALRPVFSACIIYN